MDKEQVKKLFLDFEEEGLPMHYQAQAVSMIRDGLYSGMEKDYLEAVMEYFTGCLKERREETVGAFSSADAYSRQIGLRLLNQNPQEEGNSFICAG